MWSADNVRTLKRSRVPVLASLAAALLLAGCQVRPLYSEVSTGSALGAGGSSVRQELRQIDIADARDRPEQVFRNALIFNLQGGNGSTGASAYRLTYRLQLREQKLALERITGTPTAYQVRGQLSYLLENADSGEVLMTDRVTAIASYDRSSQNFANVRAQRDGEDRVGAELARLVEIRLASYFAAR